MKKQWWHDKVAYQIYPKSFNDTNNDGIGDIKGIINKLDYLKNLGIDIIWISPMYKSPFVDQGYDISDYYSIAPEFGTMDDFEELLRQAKKRKMYILMDLVINHCSNKHEWFKKALKDPDGKYGKYFYIREGKNGKAPTNYRSYFGGSAWEKIKGTNKYYLHLFAKEQPDLNWYNPEVKSELFKMINWWLDKGLAGFRIDAIMNIQKNLDFPDFEADGSDNLASAYKFIESGTSAGEMLEEMKNATFKKYNAFTVAEVFNNNEDELKEFIGDDGHFSTMFDFSTHMLSYGKHGWYDAEEIKFEEWRNTIFESQKKCSDIGFLANIIENHDEPRGASRYLKSYARNKAGIKMLGTVSILLRGIPFIYQGQEIGMTNCKMDSIDEYNDLEAKDQYKAAINAGYTEKEALHACYEHSRDNARTPMQWDSTINAGFTKGKPWLKVNPNYKRVNVQDQEKDKKSILNYYKKLIKLRKSKEYKEIFTYGDFIPAYLENKNVCAYYRELDGKEILVAANFGENDEVIKLEKEEYEILLSNMNRKESEDKNLKLKSCEVIVLFM